MTQFIVQADDLAISHATTLGIIDSIHHGLVRNTGIFTNRPDAPFAAEALKDVTGVDIGIDLNFVTGAPILPVDAVPDLVNDRGDFRSSGQLRSTHTLVRQDGFYGDYQPEPFDHDQLHAEAKAQVERFLHLFGRAPSYVHHHSFVSVMSDQVLHEIANEYGLLVVDDLFRSGRIPLIPNDWYSSPFGSTEQATADPVAAFMPYVPQILDADITAIITHPGYVDGEIIDVSSYNIIRARDHQLVTDAGIMSILGRSGVDIVSYSQAGIIA